MNILFLCREYDRKVGYGGIGTYVDIVSRYLAKIGHKVFIICSIPRKTEEIVEKDNLVIYYAKQVHIKGVARLFKILGLESVYSRLMCALTNYLAYKKLSKKYKIDIVETPEWYNEGLFFVLQKKIPVVCRIHGANFQLSRFIRKKGFFSKINDFLSNFFETQCIKKSSYCIVPTNSVKEFIKRKFNQVKIEVIPIAISLDVFNELKVTKSKTKFVLCVGRIEKAKNTDVIVKAIPKILEYIDDIKFLFVGRIFDSYGEYVKRLVKELRVNKYVKFISSLPWETLIRLYMFSDVIVKPSTEGTLDMSLLEALASGTPLICSNIPSFKDVIEESECGVLVDPYDVEGWSKAIVDVLTNEQKTKTIITNAKKVVKEKYSVDVVCNLLVKFYSQLLGEN
jgi:glycosyltransferase involved in cell wall biosynthesis